MPTTKKSKLEREKQKKKGTLEHARKIAEKAKESQKHKRKRASDSDDELTEASKKATVSLDSETAPEDSDSSSDSSVTAREEHAEDTQTLEKKQKTGKYLKDGILAQNQQTTKG